MVEKVFDHVRQLCLNSAVALLAIITASFVLIQQQALQAHNQTLERLRSIDATLTFKLDLLVSGISRLYFTQAILADLNAAPAVGAKPNDLTDLKRFSAAFNTALSSDIAPLIVPADLPGLIDAFSLRSTSNSPFLYSYLSRSTAAAIASEDRHLGTGLAALSGDLTTIGAPEIWASLDSANSSRPWVAPEEARRRNRVNRNIESIKLPAVKFAWFICEYKAAVARDLADEHAPIFGNELYKIAVKTGNRPSEFLRSNHQLAGEEDCSTLILRSIMLSYNSIIAQSGLFEFAKDAYELSERETEIKKTIEDSKLK
jgi:hypothetical protein